MRIGICAFGLTASDLLNLAIAADEEGFDSLWLGEHLVLPVEYDSPHPNEDEPGQFRRTTPVIEPDTPLVDPLVTFAAIAARTSSLRLATGIYLPGFRHPLLTARSLATLHDLAGGRLILGVGSGWLAEEFAVFGLNFEERLPLLDECVEVLRLALAGGPFDHVGRFFAIAGKVQLTPVSIDVPIFFGGNTERALRRAALLGDGWFVSGTPDLDNAVRMRTRLLEFREENGCTGPFPTFVRIADWSPATLDRYQEAGIEDVCIFARNPYPTGVSDVWPPGSLERSRQALRDAAAEIDPRGRRTR